MRKPPSTKTFIWTDRIQLFASIIDWRPLSLRIQWTRLSPSLNRPHEKYGLASVIANAYSEKLASFPSPSAQRPKSFDNYIIFVNHLVSTLTRLEFKLDLKSKMNTQVPVQKLPYSQLVDWSNCFAQTHIESPPFEQFGEWSSSTAETLKNLELFPKTSWANRLNNPGRNHSQYGHADSRYAIDQLQATARYVFTQGKSSVMQPISTFKKENQSKSKTVEEFQKSATTLRRRTKRSSNLQGFKVSIWGRRPKSIYFWKMQKLVR